MRIVDMETWSRRQHFDFYNAFDHPHLGMCANVDLTAFQPVVKQRGISFTVAIMYVLSRVANAIPAFRRRIRASQVVEHETIHPSVTLLVDDDLFSFCTLDFTEDFARFSVSATERIAFLKEHPALDDEPGRDDLLFMTAIPWVSFTSIVHPMHLQPPDSVPRLAWGKCFTDGEFLKMPLGVQGHHALMDGLHVGRFYAQVQDHLHHPDSVLGNA